jgi:hypothetical protein
MCNYAVIILLASNASAIHIFCLDGEVRGLVTLTKPYCMILFVLHNASCICSGYLRRLVSSNWAVLVLLRSAVVAGSVR